MRRHRINNYPRKPQREVTSKINSGPGLRFRQERNVIGVVKLKVPRGEAINDRQI